jgi:ABC-type branched-subunit amino acid transport system substrate-binding protein
MRVRRLLVVLVVIGATIAAAVANGAERAGPTITVGFIGPLTGPRAVAGQPSLDGFRAGIKYLESHKLAGSPQINLIVRDSAGDPTLAVAAVRELADQGATVIYGDVDSGGFAAEQPVVNQLKVLAISSAMGGVYDKAGSSKEFPWVFSTGEGPVGLVLPDVRYLASKTKTKVIGEIYEASPFGLSQHDMTVKVMKLNYNKNRFVAKSFASSANDMTSQLSEIRASGADTLLTWTFGTNLIKLMRDLDKIGWSPTIASVLGFLDPAVIQATSQPVLAKVVSGPAPRSLTVVKRGEELSDLGKAFTTAYGEETGKALAYDVSLLVASYGFDGALLVDWAVRQAHSTKAEALRAALESGKPFTGARGTYMFGPERRVGLRFSALALVQPTTCNPGPCIAAAEQAKAKPKRK